MKLWHGVVVGVAVLTIAALLSMTLGMRLLFRPGIHERTHVSSLFIEHLGGSPAYHPKLLPEPTQTA